MTRTNDTSVDKVMDLLMRDRDFVVAVTVANNYTDVAARYTAITGSTAPRSVKELTSVLQKMLAGGQRTTVARILSVPWKDRGTSALDTAVRALRAEGVARQTDPTSFVAKSAMQPFGPLNEGEAAAAAAGGSFDPLGGGNVQETNNFWNSLPGILTSAGALVGAFTGNLPSSATGSGGAGAPPAPSGGSATKTILIILGIAAFITAAALIIRAVRKK